MQHILVPKYQSEIIPITINMLGRCGDGEYITSATVSCTVSSGTDPSPTSFLSGPATVTNQQDITQHVAGGVTGVIYKLWFNAESNLGNLYTDLVYMAVLPD